MALLEVEDLSISFGGLQALDGVSFQIEAGTIVALMGPNGAGKTSVLNCLSRVYRPRRGRMFFDGTDLLTLGPHDLARHGLCRTFQGLELFGSMTVRETLLLGQHVHVGTPIWTVAIASRGAKREERTLMATAESVAESLDLGDLLDRKVSTLPYGVQKRVDLARALVSSPKLLMLDEPAAGLSTVEIEEMQATITAVHEAHGQAILLVEHHAQFVRGIADRVCILDFGRKIADGSPGEVFRNTAVIEAYLGAESTSLDPAGNA